MKRSLPSKRRSTLLSLFPVALLLILSGCASRPAEAPQTFPSTADARPPKIAIVGGGIAGLSAAYTLEKANVPYLLLEASPRVGGRVQSRTRRVGNETLAYNPGAELIDSKHATILGFCKEFNIPLIDRYEAVQGEDTFLFDGKRYLIPEFHARLFSEEPETLSRFAEDAEAFKRGRNVKELHALSIAEYLDRIQAGALFRSYVKAGVESESGQPLSLLSAAMLFHEIGIDLKKREAPFLPENDEHYRVQGGTERLTDALRTMLPNARIQTQATVTSVVKHASGEYTVAYTQIVRKAPVQKTARVSAVILAVPAWAYLKLDLERSGVDPEAVRRWSQTQVSRNVKIQIFTKSRPWLAAGSSGTGLAQHGFQLWDSTEGLQTQAGVLTLYYPEHHPDLKGRSDRVALTKALRALEPYFPGLRKSVVGSEFDRLGKAYTTSFAPNDPLYLNPYPRAYDGVFIAGEHVGGEHQAYMEGAARTGVEAAQNAIRAIR